MHSFWYARCGCCVDEHGPQQCSWAALSPQPLDRLCASQRAHSQALASNITHCMLTARIDAAQTLTHPPVTTYHQAHLDALGALEQGQLPRGSTAKAGGTVDMEGEPEGGWTMPQLIARKPEDVIQHLEEQGLALLGEFDVADVLTFKVRGWWFQLGLNGWQRRSQS
jgi:hypothetical protein